MPLPVRVAWDAPRGVSGCSVGNAVPRRRAARSPSRVLSQCTRREHKLFAKDNSAHRTNITNQPNGTHTESTGTHAKMLICSAYISWSHWTHLLTHTHKPYERRPSILAASYLYLLLPLVALARDLPPPPPPIGPKPGKLRGVLLSFSCPDSPAGVTSFWAFGRFSLRPSMSVTRWACPLSAARSRGVWPQLSVSLLKSFFSWSWAYLSSWKVTTLIMPRSVIKSQRTATESS